MNKNNNKRMFGERKKKGKKERAKVASGQEEK